MKKVKLRFITIICLAVLFAVTLGVAFFTFTAHDAYAAKEYETTAIFSQGTDGEVIALKEENNDTVAYTAFRFKNDGKVYYRRNLALKWYEDKGAAKYFNLQFKFAGLNFEMFTITFESAEENITKEGKTENSVIFTKSTGDSLSVTIKNSAGETSEKTVSVDSNQWLTLYLTEGDAQNETQIGEFNVHIKQGELTDDFIGKFTNIGGNYLEYRSSAATTPQTPVTFTAKLPAQAEGENANTQSVLLNSLNGQALAVTGGTAEETDADGDGLYAVTGGKVEDTAAPVIVLNEQVYSFQIGQRFSTSTISYQVIDVCDGSATAKLYYYMLKADKDGEYVPLKDAEYREVTSSKPAYFLPTDEFKDGAEEIIYVSIRFDFRGNSGATENEDYVYLNWYAVDDAVAQQGEEDYIKVDRNKKGPHYEGFEVVKDNVDDEKNEFTDKDAYDEAVAAYQDAVNKAAEGANAGSGSYIYLPSLRGLITSDNADYRNLKFSVYYHKPSQSEGDSASSATSLSYNSLKFEINERGWYTFRVLATDASGNGMEYLDADGKLVTLSSSNIWDIEGIPEFKFYVAYTGVTIEDPEEQTLGYRDSKYTISSFEIVALDGVEKEYTLYYFDESALTEDKKAPSYSDFVENANKDWLTKDDEGEFNSVYGKCLKEIGKYDSSVSEDDDDWDKTDNAYEWYKNDSLSFTPQKSGFYVVEITVTDPKLSNEVNTKYQVIEVQNPFDYTPGQSEWLQNNVLSIVLFAVSAVLLVIVIALFVVKPSDKKVEEVDLKKLKGQKKNK
ncbi:MAG: hypothetical protein K2K12_04550 [Clostridia bacterium]|nr:hypothetical protein [Clostridia bacterium]